MKLCFPSRFLNKHLKGVPLLGVALIALGAPRTWGRELDRAYSPAYDQCITSNFKAFAEAETNNPNVFLNTSQFERIYKIRKQQGESEPTVILNSFQIARNYVQKFPTLKELGFNPQDYSEWTKVYSRLGRSSFFGKFVGWEKKLKNGDFARYRYDYEPDLIDPKSGKITRAGRGGHWNIEISTLNSNGKRESYKLAVQFLCSGHVCSEPEALSYLKRMNN